MRVPELVEIMRRHLLRIEHEATLDWRTSTASSSIDDHSDAIAPVSTPQLTPLSEVTVWEH